jgi:hypothetical protein
MAFRVANGTGNWSAAGTWWTAANTPTIHASTNLTVTTGGIFTQTFTAAASVDSITGVVVYPVASWSGKTITFTLQAGGVDTASTVAITGADVSLNLPLFVKLAVPVLQVATTVYRFKVTTNTGTCTIAQSVTASQIAAIITNDVTGAPASGDSVFIHSVNANTDTTVTIDNTSAICGSNAAISGSTAFGLSNRYWDMALQINGAVTGKAYLTHATGANSTIEFKNHFWQGNNGIYTCKPTSAYLATVNWTPGATANNSVAWFAQTGSQYDIEGAGLATPSYWKSKHVSGTGTAASPLIVNTPVDWTVGDYLVFHPTGNGATNYNETEYRYIITKNSSTSYVVSSTLGGSENALVNTHTGGYVFNDTAGKNVLWRSTDGNTYHVSLNNASATTANSILKWVRMRHLFSSGSAARGGLAPVAGTPLIQYVTMGTPGTTLNSQQMFFGNNSNAMTLTGIFSFNINPATSQDGVINVGSAVSNKTFNDSHVIDVVSVGWKLIGANPTLNNCTAIACGKGGVAELYAGYNISVNYGHFIDCEQHSNRLQGTLYYGSSADVVFTRFISGTLGTNGDLAHQASGQISYQTAYYDTPTYADTNLMTGNLLLIEGSQIVFANVNGTAYNNYKYTNNGQAVFTGPGLTDTTVPNIGSYAYRHDPLTSTGIKYRYLQLVTPNAVFITYGRVWGNSAFVTDGATTITANLYMPGVAEGDTPSATVTMTKTTDKTSANAVYQLSATNTVTIPTYALVVVTLKNPSATSSVYAYIGDILNAENDNTKFKAVFEGQPTRMMPLGANTDPGAVSTYVWADTASYASGTKGKIQSDSKLTNVLAKDKLS